MLRLGLLFLVVALSGFTGIAGEKGWTW